MVWLSAKVAGSKPVRAGGGCQSVGCEDTYLGYSCTKYSVTP